MEREITLDCCINKLSGNTNILFTQGDINTHILNLNLDRSMDLNNYTMIVTYILPYGYTPIVEVYSPQPTQRLTIPSEALQKAGKVYIEISFLNKIDRNLLTVNQRASFNVISTVNGTRYDAVAGATTSKTIAEQIALIDKMFEDKKVELEKELENMVSERVDIIIDTKLTENIREVLASISSAGDSAVAKVGVKQDSAILAINNHVSQKETSLSQLASEKSLLITNAGNKSVSDIKEQETTSLGVVTAKETELTTLGDAKVKLVTDTANSKITEINTEANKKIQAVQTEGTTQVTRVVEEGNRQVDRVQNAGGGASV